MALDNDASEDSNVDHDRLHNASFHKWRPRFHIMAPWGWMNDPCAIGYDRKSGLYHVGFQWNPKGYRWGNMSWGSATSLDMVDWSVGTRPSLEPTETEDRAGVFTGALAPRDGDGDDGILTAFYTSAARLPIHYTLPYHRGSELVHRATSVDQGRTWRRDERNPIVGGPPSLLEVTGWRDPHVTRWAQLDRLLGSEVPQWYAFVSGGIKGSTPTVFLYRVDGADMEQWTVLDNVVDLGLNWGVSRWTGDYGINFECTNLVTLSSDEDDEGYDFMITSVEGAKPLAHHTDKSEMISDHVQMWFCGRLEKSDEGIRFNFRFGGILDHGCLYASTVMLDPVTGRYVLLGWIMEADLSPDLTASQQWSGCLSIPRVLGLSKLHSVTGALRTELSDLANVEVRSSGQDLYEVTTLSIRPEPRLTGLRVREIAVQPPINLSSESHLSQHGAAQMEVRATFDMSDVGSYGLALYHSADLKQVTYLYFDPATKEFVIDRSRSSLQPGVGTTPEKAPHTLFTFRSADEREAREALEVHAFFDTSVLEVFVNDRTCITTRVYPDSGMILRVSRIRRLEDTIEVMEPSAVVGIKAWELRAMRSQEGTA